MLCHGHNEEVLPHVQVELLMFQFVLSALYHWALLKRAQLHPLDFHPFDICKH